MKESRYGHRESRHHQFQTEVLGFAEPVVVDFWAEWCGPCKMIAPSLEEISNEMAGKVKVAKLNIDENPELAAQFGVRSIPTLAMFKGGEVADHEGRRRARRLALIGLDQPAPSADRPRSHELRKPGFAPGFFRFGGFFGVVPLARSTSPAR